MISNMFRVHVPATSVFAGVREYLVALFAKYKPHDEEFDDIMLARDLADEVAQLLCRARNLNLPGDSERLGAVFANSACLEDQRKYLAYRADWLGIVEEAGNIRDSLETLIDLTYHYYSERQVPVELYQAHLLAIS